MDPQEEEVKNFLDDLNKDLGITKPQEEKKVNQEEKKVNQEEKKPDEKIEEAPVFERKPQQKATKEESIATLRKQRDELKEATKIFTDVFGDHKPTVIKPILDYIVEQADGPITEDFVIEKITEFKSLKEKADELEREVRAREQKVQELDIRESKEFNEKFKVPYTRATEELYLEFIQLGPDKKVIGPVASRKLQEFLTSTEEIDGVAVKAALTEFAREYKSETGEDPVLPSVTDLMKARRNFVLSREAMSKAYTNWKQVKLEEQKKKAIEEQTQSEAQIKAAKKARTEAVSKAYREFDLDLIPFVEDKELETLFKEEFEFGEKIHNQEEIPEYHILFQRGVKARLWDKYSAELAELRKFKEDFEAGERNHIPGSGRPASKGTGKEIDWLTGKPK